MPTLIATPGDRKRSGGSFCRVCICGFLPICADTFKDFRSSLFQFFLPSLYSLLLFTSPFALFLFFESFFIVRFFTHLFFPIFTSSSFSFLLNHGSVTSKPAKWQRLTRHVVYRRRYIDNARRLTPCPLPCARSRARARHHLRPRPLIRATSYDPQCCLTTGRASSGGGDGDRPQEESGCARALGGHPRRMPPESRRP